MLSGQALPARRGPPRRWPQLLPNISGQQRRRTLALLVLALSLFMTQSFGQQACPVMPFHDCMMAAGAETSASSVAQEPNSSCCPFQKMANGVSCAGIACYSAYVAMGRLPRTDTSFQSDSHWFPTAKPEQVDSFSANIFHPPRPFLS